MFNSEVNVDRLLLLFGIIIYPFWGYVFLNIDKNFYDPYSHRFIISGYIFLVFICTFIFEERRKLLDFLIYFVIYLVTFKQVQLIHKNALSIEYFTGYIIIIISLISYFKTIRQILSYSLFCIFLIILIFAVEKEINLSIFIFYISSVFTISFFLSVIYFVKIANQNKLIDFSMQLKENEEKYRILLESVPDAIITVNQKGEIISANRRAVEMFEYDFSELQSKKIENLMPDRYRKIHENNRESYRKSPKIREMGSGKSLFGLTKSGKEVPVEISLSPVIDNKHEFKVIALIRDISQKIETEKELTEVRSKLQEKEITEKLSRAKSEFISKMSHEIRTPLNGIYGFTNILLKEKLNSEQRQYLESIKFSSDILKTLINDILDNTNIESGKITLMYNEIKIKEIFGNVIHNFDVQIQSKDLQFTIDYVLDPVIDKFVLKGDSLRISQIIMNLLSNAIKFSDPHKEVCVKVNTMDLDEKHISLFFSISNYGLTIPKDKLEEIFEPYAQISSDITQRFGGTGLGLSIVKNLVTLMNGSIKVVSEEKTTFSIQLPILKEKPREETLLRPKKGDQGGKLHRYKKVLVAEDNKLNQLLIQTILGKNGLETTLVENGLEVIEVLKTGNFDLILMDIQMPEMDGIECTKTLRKQEQFNTPVIALTADIKKENVLELQELFDGLIKKPFDEDELLKIIYSV